MKRWAALVIILYAVVLSLLAYPVFLLLPGPFDPSDDPSDLVKVYFVWIAPVLLVVQAVLLLIPVASVQQRPIKRRSIAVSAFIAGIPMAALTLSFVLFALLMAFTENFAGFPNASTFQGIFAILWLVWGFIFLRSYANQNPNALLSTITQWLLKGSILELLVAVPSHIISRRRDECCAPAMTLLGIAMGLAIALLSFGPGLFFLFARRIKDKTRAAAG
jgi:hypothetical protein